MFVHASTTYPVIALPPVYSGAVQASRTVFVAGADAVRAVMAKGAVPDAFTKVVVDTTPGALNVYRPLMDGHAFRVAVPFATTVALKIEPVHAMTAS
jgi:hypothetical protein